MELKRIAAISVLVGGLVVSVAVGFWDWRAGLGVAGALLVAGGIASLRSPDG
jgi:hypothetical protein